MTDDLMFRAQVFKYIQSLRYSSTSINLETIAIYVANVFFLSIEQARELVKEWIRLYGH